MSDFFYFTVYLLDNLISVGAADLIDGNVHTRASIGLTNDVIVL